MSDHGTPFAVCAFRAGRPPRRPSLADSAYMTAPSGRKSRILVLGAGGHGRVVLDILMHRPEFEIVGFLDNNPDIHGRRVDGTPVLGGIDDLSRVAGEQAIDGVVIAIGDNGVRRGFARQIQQAGIELVRAVHPAASIASTATLGRNTVVAAGVVLCANCQVGDSVILNTGCIVDHQSMVGEGVHICPGVRIGARVKIESGAFIGVGATIVPNVTIGCEAVVGAGAVVIESVPPMATVVGVPARTIRLSGASEDDVAMLFPAGLTRSGH